MDRPVRIGIDVGGTFTDFVLHDPTRSITLTAKHLTTPSSPSRAIIEGLVCLLRESETSIALVGRIVHGTTLATNMLLERTGARVGLLTNDGFSDVLEMGREIRFDVEDLHARPAPVLVPRRRRLGIPGRIAADGSEVAPLDAGAVLTALRHLVDHHGIEALAVSFLHAYVNPTHERRVRAIAAGDHPALPVTLSAEVAAEIGEYERTTTACVNAYVQPVMSSYLERLQAELESVGFAGRLQMMLSSGGVTTPEHAKAFPVKLLESGPAAGALAAGFLARQAGEARVIAFDMGGTTAKMSLIDDGSHQTRHTFEAARVDTFKPGSGLPLRLTVVDMIEIGSGGGSIAAVNELGLLTVGPRSAGSVPGPVAYGRGGHEPTVTDSDVMLGYIDPTSFLGGEMPLEIEQVHDIVDETLAQPLRLDPQKVAVGIHDVVTETMAAATRTHMAEKGRDPRAYTLMAFGGAGPVHVYALAKRLKVPRILVPMGAGVISAFGFLVAAPTAEAARGYPTPLDRVDWMRAQSLLDEMEEAARTLLSADGKEDPQITVRRSADMRYVGQGFEIEVALPAGPLTADREDAIRDAFSEAYRATFGRMIDEAHPELVTWRCSAAGPESPIRLASQDSGVAARASSRQIRFLDFGDIETAVYDRYGLQPGTTIQGPALFTERTTSCSFGPDCLIRVDESRNLVVDIES